MFLYTMRIKNPVQFFKAVKASIGSMSAVERFQEVLDAQKRIAPYINATPVMTSRTLNDIIGRNIFLKCESFQKTGSFKARGALNTVLKLKSENPDLPGVVTHSSGNHGQALAWASKTAGVKCTIVVPGNCPNVKREAIKGYGAELVVCEPNPKSRENTCNAIAESKGYLYIPSADNLDVIAGQGTIATDLLSQVPDLDAIFVPICGGGMAAGVCVATRALSPKTKVFGVVPKGKTLGESLKAGKRLEVDCSQFVDTIADGLRLPQVGANNFPIMYELMEREVLTVNDEEIINAMKFIFQRMKLVVEPSSAATIAAAMSDTIAKMDPEMRNIAVVISGGNVDVEKLPWISSD